MKVGVTNGSSLRKKTSRLQAVRWWVSLTRRNWICLFTLVGLAMLPSAVLAEVNYDKRIVQLENDVFAGSDQHYTNGVRMTWASSPAAGYAPRNLGWAKLLGSRIVLCVEQSDTRCYRVAKERAIAQNMYTPRNIRTPGLQPNDRPYAGWLHFSDGWDFVSERNRHEVRLDLGVVGSASLAEEAQSAIHNVINSADPKGWSHQLKSEPTVQLSYRYRHKVISIETKGSGARILDITPFVFGTVGNALDIGAVGFSFRAGWNLPDDFLDKMELVRLAEEGTPAKPIRNELRAYLFGQAEERLVAANIFVEGSLFRDGHGVPRKDLVSVYEWGVAVGCGAVTLSYRLVTRGPEFRGQDREHSYGVLLFAFSPWCRSHCGR